MPIKLKDDNTITEESLQETLDIVKDFLQKMKYPNMKIFNPAIETFVGGQGTEFISSNDITITIQGMITS